MYEVEVKVPADHDDVRARLREADARDLGVVDQRDTYFDAPHRDFAATDEALRVRRERRDGGRRAVCTYKGPLVDEASKTREERELEVADADDATALFEGLGFEAAHVVEKTRHRYVLDGYVVSLDEVAGLGAFVEVEREVDDGDLDSAREGAFEVLVRLGLDPADQVRTSYLGLLLDD
ncbi:MAG: class IV adenylate cyclase [Halobacteriaceae archaeon]